jgi:hypothetical protein
MRKLLTFSALLLLAATALLPVGCASLSAGNAETLAKLKPVAKVGVAIAQSQGKITPDQAVLINSAIDSVTGTNVDLAALGKLALAGLEASGKITPAQAAQIQLILDALNSGNVTAEAADSATSTALSSFRGGPDRHRDLALLAGCAACG